MISLPGNTKKIKISLAFLFSTCASFNLWAQSTFVAKQSYNGEWTHFPGIPHKATNSIYIPGGYAFADLKQVLRYDITNDTWSAVAGPAGMQSQLGYSFTIGNRMFFGGGADLGFVFGNQLWEFVPPATYIARDNVPVSNGLCATFSFSIGNFGYVGEGYGWNGSVVSSNTLYRYNPAAAPGSQWTTMTPYPGLGQINNGCVTLNGSAYVACGRSAIGTTEYNDFWRYTPGAGGGTWTALPSFPGPAREHPVLARTCNDKIILMGGLDAGTGVNYDDVWLFDPLINSWLFVASDPTVWGAMEGRYGPAYCAYGDSLFFGMGYGTFGPNDDFNMFTYCPISVLPVELTAFTATSNTTNQVDITWETAAEINNQYFTVYTSTNATDWEEVATVSGAGNSSSSNHYHTLDASPHIGLNYYQLKQVDFDGTETWSGIISVVISHYSNAGLTVFPNPAGDMMQLNYLSEQKNITYTVINSTGDVVLTGKLDDHQHQLNTGQLAQGVYHISVNDPNHTTLRFIKK